MRTYSTVSGKFCADKFLVRRATKTFSFFLCDELGPSTVQYSLLSISLTVSVNGQRINVIQSVNVRIFTAHARTNKCVSAYAHITILSVPLMRINSKVRTVIDQVEEKVLNYIQSSMEIILMPLSITLFSSFSITL